MWWASQEEIMLDWNAFLHHWFSLLIELCLSHLADPPQSAWTICASLVSNRLILLGLRIGRLELQPAEAASGSASGSQAQRNNSNHCSHAAGCRDWRAVLRSQRQQGLKSFLQLGRIKYGAVRKRTRVVSACFSFSIMYSPWILPPLSPQAYLFPTLLLCHLNPLFESKKNKDNILKGKYKINKFEG